MADKIKNKKYSIVKIINTILKGKLNKMQRIILTATPIAKIISDTKNENLSFIMYYFRNNIIKLIVFQ